LNHLLFFFNIDGSSATLLDLLPQIVEAVMVLRRSSVSRFVEAVMVLRRSSVSRSEISYPSRNFDLEARTGTPHSMEDKQSLTC